ncbi:hypothetical protein ACF0H5_002966 [Mactra antiquata]
MSALYQLTKEFNKLNEDTVIVCYEKQSTWGGHWNLQIPSENVRFKEAMHSAMYKHLWSNSPKECLELPDYTFYHHFGKAVPSFPPREVLRDYMEGRWKQSQCDLFKLVNGDTLVKNVTYNDSDDTFSVTTSRVGDNRTATQIFSHVIVAVGRYTTPNVPKFTGVESFPGRIIHSRDFRNPVDFRNQRILVVGASYSAEDIALTCSKFGAKRVTVSWLTSPIGHRWPEGISERPLVKHIDGNRILFKDGHIEEVDSIIWCTGYIAEFPFMESRLAPNPTQVVYPKGLYKGMVWTGCNTNKLFYMGIYNLLYTFPVFDLQALWISRYIMNAIPNEPRPLSDMILHIEEQFIKTSGLKSFYDYLDYQALVINMLCTDTGYTKEILKFDDLFRTWLRQRYDDILTHRNHCYRSVFTGTMSAKPNTPWWEARDDSKEAFLR